MFSGNPPNWWTEFPLHLNAILSKCLSFRENFASCPLPGFFSEYSTGNRRNPLSFLHLVSWLPVLDRRLKDYRSISLNRIRVAQLPPAFLNLVVLALCTMSTGVNATTGRAPILDLQSRDVRWNKHG